MTGVRLILEHAPTSQAVTEIAYHGGEMNVGRGEDADWRIYDPEAFVSRKHFVLSTEGGRVVLTDASSGGLFVDGSETALGPGNSVTVEDGMRVRFGDFVARVEMMGAVTKAEPVAAAAKASPFDFSFEPVKEAPPAPERPDDLPEPFGKSSSPFFDTPAEEKAPPPPIDRENPFALGLKPAAPEADAPSEPRASFFDDPFGTEEPASAPVQAPLPEPRAATPATDPQPVAPAVTGEAALRAAFFKGLGLDPSDIPAADPVAEMEALGKRFRILADGITHLLRTRAEEKNRVRVAQTIVGANNVNPLKFAVTADEAVRSLVTERGSGYLGPDDSLDEAFRDLIDHQVRTWSALQTALRRMIDKFDPEAIEKELAETGLLETLMAGGKSAKLWQLYEERYEDIARAAEERFLGEVGADFRDAYERK